MKLRRLLPVLVLVSCSLSARAGERMQEVYRSRYGALRLDGVGVVAALNPTDGSLWEVEGATVTRISAGGVLLARSPALHAPSALAVDPREGSCWVRESISSVVTHLSPAGKVLSTTEDDPLATGLVVSPFDGSAWTTGRAAHIGAAGDTLWRPGWTCDSVWAAGDGSAWLVQKGVGAGPQAVHVQADGTEVKRLPSVATIWGLDPQDGSLWMTAGVATPLQHLSSDGTGLGQYTPTAQVAGLAISPFDGSAWVYDHAPGAGSPAVVHVSAAGTELNRYTDADLLSYNSEDGSVWRHLATGDLVQAAADGTELRRNTADLWGSPYVYDPAGNAWWTVAGGEVQRIGADGAVVWAEQLLTLGQLPGAHGWANPLLGSVWAWEASAASGSAFLQLSTEGEPLQRRAPSLPPRALAIVPSSGAWWLLCDDGSGGTVLLQLASDGSELQRFPGMGTGPLVADASDGSAWIVDNYTVTTGTDTAPACHIHHLGADGTTLGSADLPYGCYSVDPQPRGRPVWFTATNGTPAQDKLVQLASDGQVAAELTVGESGLGAKAVATHSDGSLYVARTGVFSGAVVREVSRRLTDGTVLWSDSGFTNPTQLAVSPRDSSLWVLDAGETIPSGSHAPGYGSAVVHLAADGTELSRGDTFCQPTAIDLVPLENGAWIADTGNGQLVHVRAVFAPFSDVSVDYWAFDAINACVDAGIVKGYPDGTYQPGLVVSRDQMAVYISRALAGGDANVPSGPATATFTDVPTDQWAFPYVEYAFAQHIVAGYPDGTYAPTLPVDRAQMAVFVARAIVTPTGEAGLADYVPPPTPSFTDVPISFWSYRHIEYLKGQGVVGEYPDGLYHPEYAVTRDQMAVYLARAFKLLL